MSLKGILKKISQIDFGLMSPENIRKMSVTKIVTPDTYDEDGYPIEAGLMDPRLGVIDPGLRFANHVNIRVETVRDISAT